MINIIIATIKDWNISNTIFYDMISDKRSLEAIKLNAKYQGCRVGLEYVEAFKLIRSVI